MITASAAQLSLQRLRDDAGAEVIAPGDATYDGARAIFAPQFDRRPAAIVRPRDAYGVSRVIELARESGSELAVRSGGHSVAGHSVTDGGIVLNLTRLKALHIDPDSVMPAPPMPFVPEERHGEFVIFAMLLHTGPQTDGERAVAPFRALADPIVDMVRPLPYPNMYPPDAEAGPLAVARTMFLEQVDEAVAARILDHLRSSSAQMPVAQLRVLGGAMAGVPDDWNRLAAVKREYDPDNLFRLNQNIPPRTGNTRVN